jgi:hypothetical protein
VISSPIIFRAFMKYSLQKVSQGSSASIATRLQSG